MASVCMVAEPFVGQLMNQNLVWDVAKLIVASDYDPLLRHTDDPDYGAKQLYQLIDKTITGQVVKRNFTYWSRDTRGDSILLSACIILPKEGDIRQIIVANHYTICTNEECPTESMPFEAVFCLKGYAVLMADYIGYGESTGKIHPYLGKLTESQTVTDMILHVIGNDIVFPQNKRQKMQLCNRSLLSDSVIMIGYSEGAAVTLATAEYITAHYADKINLQALYVGGGPYCPAKMYDEWVKNDYTAIPFAIPMTIVGMDEAEHLELNLTGLFREQLLSNYKEWILSQKYTINQIAELMNSNHLSAHMPSEGMDKTHPNTAKFYEAMQHQDLTSFQPTMPLYLFHSTKDQWVPFSGSKQLVENILQPQWVTTDFGDYGNHPIAAIEFYKRVYKQL